MPAALPPPAPAPPPLPIVPLAPACAAPALDPAPALSMIPATPAALAPAPPAALAPAPLLDAGDPALLTPPAAAPGSEVAAEQLSAVQSALAMTNFDRAGVPFKRSPVTERRARKLCAGGRAPLQASSVPSSVPRKRRYLASAHRSERATFVTLNRTT
jgi:hypothetical protein